MITFDISHMLAALSGVLDMVEKDLLGATSNHSKRVAYLCAKMGKSLSFSDEQLTALVCCAVMHDSALTEYLYDEQLRADIKYSGPMDCRPHCLAGERNISVIPLDPIAKNAVLYHHEEANGRGAFGKTAAETPIAAQLIHFGDQIDVQFVLSEMTEEKEAEIEAYRKNNVGVLFAPDVIALFRRAVTKEELYALDDEQINGRLFSQLNPLRQTYTNEEFMRLATMFAHIVDYKSPFTRAHSVGLAEKARRMGAYYGMDEEKQSELYFAGAVHDVGKLIIQNDILEKPDKLTGEEYITMQNHAYASYMVLRQMEGLEDVASWAYLHHEKLDGSGYPFGLSGSKLNHEQRLMGCLDIYQALVEPRPYKDGMPHEKAVRILRDMAKSGKIDPIITEDIARCFSAA